MMIKEFVHKFCLAAREAGIEKLNFYIEENQRREIPSTRIPWSI